MERELICTACGGNNWELSLGTHCMIMVCKVCTGRDHGFGSVSPNWDRSYGLVINRSRSTFSTADHALAYVDSEPIKF